MANDIPIDEVPVIKKEGPPPWTSASTMEMKSGKSPCHHNFTVATASDSYSVEKPQSPKSRNRRNRETLGEKKEGKPAKHRNFLFLAWPTRPQFYSLFSGVSRQTRTKQRPIREQCLSWKTRRTHKTPPQIHKLR